MGQSVHRAFAPRPLVTHYSAGKNIIGEYDRPAVHTIANRRNKPRGVGMTQAILALFLFFVLPGGIIWGWVRWTRRREPRNLPSLIAFMFTSLSGLLAVSSIAYSNIVGGFYFYDPWLLKIYGVGILLSAVALVFGLAGMWRPSSLRWHAPICAAGSLVFWLLAASGE
jgi:hypothetical protein